MLRLSTLLWIAGLLHLTVPIASAMVPGALDWRSELARLSRLTRQLVWVHGAFIVLVIVGFGAVTMCNAAALASGSVLARSLCGLIAVFWAARLLLGLVLFDPGPYLTSTFMRLGYRALTGLFLFFVAAYGYAALFAG